MSKNLPVLSGNLQENHLVQKSVPVLMMRNDPFSFGELKLLDTYLSRINSHDFQSRRVSFTKSEYETLMGISEMRVDQLKKYTGALMSKIAEIRYSKDKFKQINIFCEAEFERNDFDEWIITLECSAQAKKYIFNPEKVGYIKYLLKYSIGMKSKHSFQLYGYLLYNRFRGSWSEPLDFLKHDVFKIDPKKPSSYDEFKDFKRYILDKSIAEINEQTDIEFKYKTEKKGRTVVAIHFELVKNKDEYVDQISLVDFSEEDEYEILEDKYDEHLKLIASACDYEFSNDQMKMISALIADAIDVHGPKRDLAKHQFVYLQYMKMKVIAADKKKKPIVNRFNYLLEMIKSEVEKRSQE